MDVEFNVVPVAVEDYVYDSPLVANQDASDNGGQKPAIVSDDESPPARRGNGGQTKRSSSGLRIYKWRDGDAEHSLYVLVKMLKLENAHGLPCFDYMFLHKKKAIGYIDESYRKMIVNWMRPIVDYFEFDRDVVSIAMSYLDRAIAQAVKKTGKRVTQQQFQLTALTALNLAIKLHGEVPLPCIDASTGGENHSTSPFHAPCSGTPRESPTRPSVTEGGEVKELIPMERPVKVAMSTFVSLGRDQFTMEQVKNREVELLFELDWHLNPPTMLCFLTLLMTLFPVSWEGKIIDSEVATIVFEFALYLTELSLGVSGFSFRFKASDIVHAAIRCAINILKFLSTKMPLEAGNDFLYRVRLALEQGSSYSEQNEIIILEICSMLMDEFVKFHESGEAKTDKGPSKPCTITEEQLGGLSEAVRESNSKRSASVLNPQNQGVSARKRKKLEAV
jgi:hypothetical protein